MTYQNNSLGFPAQATDGTWVLADPEQPFNGFSVTLPVDRNVTEPFKVGQLVRLSQRMVNGEKVLWRVVAQTPGVFGPVAVLVPTDVPASVPATSVERAEQTVETRPHSANSEKLAA